MDCTATWHSITTMLVPQIYYMHPATPLSKYQCNLIMRPCLHEGLPATGYLRALPHTIVHALYKYFELGLMGMYMEQGIQHILTLLQHGHRLYLTGWLLRGSLESLQLELWWWAK